MKRSCCGVVLNQTVICLFILSVIAFVYSIIHFMHNYFPDKSLAKYIAYIVFCFLLRGSGHRGK